MITKEENPKLDNKKNEKLDEEELSEKYRRRWKMAILGLITLSIIMTILVIYILMLYGLGAYNPYETKIINVASEGKNWYTNENINIFKNRNKDGEKTIWPGDSGEYDFIVQNENSIPIYYKIKLSEENKDKVNMKYRLKLNNVYVVGDEKNYVSIDKMNLEDVKILENSKCIYTLEWKWEESNNDTELVRNGLATYRIYIDIYSKSISDVF